MTLWEILSRTRVRRSWVCSGNGLGSETLLLRWDGFLFLPQCECLSFGSSAFQELLVGFWTLANMTEDTCGRVALCGLGHLGEITATVKIGLCIWKTVTEISFLLVHSPDYCNGWSWAYQEAGTDSGFSTWVHLGHSALLCQAHWLGAT